MKKLYAIAGLGLLVLFAGFMWTCGDGVDLNLFPGCEKTHCGVGQVCQMVGSWGESRPVCRQDPKFCKGAWCPAGMHCSGGTDEHCVQDCSSVTCPEGYQCAYSLGACVPNSPLPDFATSSPDLLQPTVDMAAPSSDLLPGPEDLLPAVD